MSIGTPFRLTSADFVNALQGVTNNGTAMHFGNTARLMFKQIVSPLTLVVNSFGTNRQAIVREKISGRVVDTDVSRFFSAGDNYVSARAVNGGTEAHKISALSFNSPGKLVVQLSVLLVENTATSANNVARLRSLNWSGQGVGRTTFNTPNLVISGGATTGQPRLE